MLYGILYCSRRYHWTRFAPNIKMLEWRRDDIAVIPVHNNLNVWWNLKDEFIFCTLVHARSGTNSRWVVNFSSYIRERRTTPAASLDPGSTRDETFGSPGHTCNTGSGIVGIIIHPVLFAQKRSSGRIRYTIAVAIDFRTYTMPTTTASIKRGPRENLRPGPAVPIPRRQKWIMYYL